MNGRVAAAALISTLAAALLAAQAGAGEQASTRITLKVGDGTSAPVAHGRVLSKEPACRSGRTVVLHAVAPDAGPIDLADNKTNAKGKWKFSSQLQGATSVQARVKERTVDGITCKGARSPVKALP